MIFISKILTSTQELDPLKRSRRTRKKKIVKVSSEEHSMGSRQGAKPDQAPKLQRTTKREKKKLKPFIYLFL